MSAKKPSAVVALWGEDPFLLREAADGLLEGLARTEVDAADWTGTELSDLSTPSLLGERRGLLVTATGAKSGGTTDRALEAIAAFAAAPAPDARLVLAMLTPAARAVPPALKPLAGAGAEIRRVAAPPRKELPRWLVARARGVGLDLAGDGAAALVEVLGEDPGTLAQALEQLASAFAGRRVDREAVRSQFSGLGEERVWDLCDRAFAGDAPGALHALRSMIEAGEPSLKILGGIAARLRDLQRVRALPPRTAVADLAKVAGLRFDWQARRYRDQAARFSGEELAALHRMVAETDAALKSGGSGTFDDVAMTRLVGTISSRGAGGRRSASLAG